MALSILTNYCCFYLFLLCLVSLFGLFLASCK